MTAAGEFADYRRVVREHVFDKCWALDLAWAEIDGMVAAGEVVERHNFGSVRIKERRLLQGWTRPLHLVYLIDHERRTIVYVTIYEPDLDHWQPGFRKRRR